MSDGDSKLSLVLAIGLAVPIVAFILWAFS